MNPYKWAAVVVFGWAGLSTIVGVCTGRWLADLRRYQAEYARENQGEVRR